MTAATARSSDAFDNVDYLSPLPFPVKGSILSDGSGPLSEKMFVLSTLENTKDPCANWFHHDADPNRLTDTDLHPAQDTRCDCPGCTLGRPSGDFRPVFLQSPDLLGKPSLLPKSRAMLVVGPSESWTVWQEAFSTGWGGGVCVGNVRQGRTIDAPLGQRPLFVLDYGILRPTSFVKQFSLVNSDVIITDFKTLLEEYRSNGPLFKHSFYRVVFDDAHVARDAPPERFQAFSALQSIFTLIVSDPDLRSRPDVIVQYCNILGFPKEVLSLFVSEPAVKGGVIDTIADAFIIPRDPTTLFSSSHDRWSS